MDLFFKLKPGQNLKLGAHINLGVDYFLDLLPEPVFFTGEILYDWILSVHGQRHWLHAYKGISTLLPKFFLKQFFQFFYLTVKFSICDEIVFPSSIYFLALNGMFLQYGKLLVKIRCFKFD